MSFDNSIMPQFHFQFQSKQSTEKIQNSHGEIFATHQDFFHCFLPQKFIGQFSTSIQGNFDPILKVFYVNLSIFKRAVIVGFHDAEESSESVFASKSGENYVCNQSTPGLIDRISR